MDDGNIINDNSGGDGNSSNSGGSTGEAMVQAPPCGACFDDETCGCDLLSLL